MDYLKHEFASLLRSEDLLIEYLNVNGMQGAFLMDLTIPNQLWFNDQLLRKLGYPKSDFLRDDIWHSILKQKELTDLIKRISAQNSPFAEDVFLSCKDVHGNELVMEGFAFLDLGRSDSSKRLLYLTKRLQGKQKNRRLPQSMATWADLIFNGTHDGMAMIQMNQGKYYYQFVNHAFKRFLDLDDSQIIGKTPVEIFGEASGNQMCKLYDQCIKKGVPMDVEEEILKDRDSLFFQTTLSPIWDEEGKEHIIAFKKNITKQKHEEAQFKMSQYKLSFIMSATPDIIVLIDSSYRINFINRSLFSIHEDDMIGTSMFDYLPSVDHGRIRNTIHNVFLDREQRQYDLAFPFEDGTTRHFRSRVSYVGDSAHEPEVIIVATDVTDSLEKEQDIHRWENIFLHAKWGIAISQSNGFYYHQVNPEFAKMHGYDVHDIEKKMELTDLFVEEERTRAREIIAEIEQAGHFVWESIHKRKDGSSFPVLIDASLIRDNEGFPAYRAVSIQDISQIKTLERKLAEEKSLFQTTLMSIGDGVISTDVDGNVLFLNLVAEKMTGWDSKEAVGKPLEEVFHIVSEHTLEPLANPARAAMETGQVCLMDSHSILIRKDGIGSPVEDSAAPIFNEDGVLFGAVIVFRDYAEKKEKLQKIEFLSFHDQLTGLYNRRYFDQELARLDYSFSMPVSILMLDVNGLKLTNDAFGHAAGDRLLQSVADVLQASCRKEDIIARIGGDEFVVLLPNSGLPTTEYLKERIYRSILEMKFDSIVVSVSIGSSTRETPKERLEDVLTRAEGEMYRRKIKESQNMRSNTVKVILQKINESNEREKTHAERVSKIARVIGSILHLSKDKLHDLEIAGTLHDIGKIGIDRSILQKPEELSEEEYAEVKRHLEIGYQIIKSVNEFTSLADTILSHHEWYDGTGYPRGLKGEEIPLFSRIIAIADAYEAMTGNRTYRESLDPQSAFLELEKGAGSQFDPIIIASCQKNLWRQFSIV